MSTNKTTNNADRLKTLRTTVARSREVNLVTERLTAWSERWVLRGAYVHCLGCRIGRRHSVAKPFEHVSGCELNDGSQPYPWDELAATLRMLSTGAQ
jgi:hypothetical protein